MTAPRPAGLIVFLLTLLLTACAGQPPVVDQPQVAWDVDLEYAIQFQQMVDEHLMLVGTSRHLLGIDPQTGQTLWRARNISARSEDVIAVTDAPYVLVMDAAGGSFGDRDTHVLALARHDGSIQWESPRIPGRILQAVVDPDSERMYAVTVRRAHGDDTGVLADLLPGKGIGAGFKREPQLIALDLRSGRVLWTRPFGDHVPLRPANGRALDENGDWQEQRAFDLGLFHEPFIAGAQVCVTFTGVSCFSSATGKPTWSNRFDVNDGDLALSYSSALVRGDSIILSGDGRMRALNLASGKTTWTSKDSDAIPDVQESGAVLFAQLGGRFFDIMSEEWKWQGEFGVMAIDRNSGKKLWKYNDADDSITNVLLFSSHAWFADEDDLIVVDQRSGKRTGHVAHDFESPPVYAALNDRGQVVLVNENEAAAIDPKTLELLWHVHYTPPGPGAWARFSSSLLQFSGNVLRFTSTVVAYSSGLVPTIPGIPVASSNISVKLLSSKRIVGDLTGRAGRRMSYRSDAAGEARSAARLSGEYQYFITQTEGTERPAIAMVELGSGRTERMIELPHAEPNLLIDDTTDSLFQVDGSRLTAIRMHDGAAVASLR